MYPIETEKKNNGKKNIYIYILTHLQVVGKMLLHQHLLISEFKEKVFMIFKI